MSAGLFATVARLPVRQLHLLGAGLLLCVGASVWLFALRTPLASLGALEAETARLQGAAADPQRLASRLALVNAESAHLLQRLGAARPAQGGQQLALADAIGRLAAADGVALRGVTPAPEQPVLTFGQAGFDADASGKYQALLDWMGDIERSAPNLSIAGFDMHSSKEGGVVEMKVRVAAYQPHGVAP